MVLKRFREWFSIVIWHKYVLNIKECLRLAKLRNAVIKLSSHGSRKLRGLKTRKDKKNFSRKDCTDILDQKCIIQRKVQREENGTWKLQDLFGLLRKQQEYVLNGFQCKASTLMPLNWKNVVNMSLGKTERINTFGLKCQVIYIFHHLKF